MNEALSELIAARCAESRSEWRLLPDPATLTDFLFEAGWGNGDPLPPTGLNDDGRGFTLADGLIAETGSVVLSARHPGARRCAFLADAHYVLCAEETIVDRLADLLAAAGPEWRERCGHSLTLITGPSRTADIEKVLVLGAHGPRRLVIGCAPRSLLAERFGEKALPAEFVR